MKTYLTIKDMYNNRVVTVTDPLHIPRVGEEVLWSYEPVPVVTRVLHQYKDNAHHIVIMLK